MEKEILKCQCGTEQFTALRQYSITKNGIIIPFFVGSFKCPTCLKFNNTPMIDFHLLHTVNLLDKFFVKVHNGRTM